VLASSPDRPAIVRVVLAALAIVGAVLVVPAGSSPAQAAVIRPFSIRYQNDLNGAIDIFANTLMTCPTTASTCTAARNPATGSTTYSANNSFNMVMVDADGSAFPTVNSSNAVVSFPPTAAVRFAGIYWGAQSNAATRNQMKLRGPGDAAYTTFTAAALDASGSAYQGFANVTSFVQARGIGTYWGADVAATTGSNQYAGWALVVVWEDSSQPLRNLTVFDGFGIVQNTTADRTITIPLSGFLTPPFGPVQTEVGVVAYEGDRGSGATGDVFRLNTTNLSNAANPVNDVFNGSISDAGVNDTNRNPAYINSLGFDADEFNAGGILPNSSTSATVTLTTGGETFYPGVISTAIDLYAPTFPQQTKSVTNLTRGTDPALPGDVLEYTLSVINTGLDPSVSTVISDALPPNTTFVPGSLVILTGANAGAKTDASGDDQANYDTAARTVRFRIGTGANATAGGTINPNAATSMRFRVRVDPAAAGTSLTNQFRLDYIAQTINRPFSYNSNPVTTPVTPLADLRITKSASPSPLVAGTAATYTVTVTNNGPSPAQGVVVTDTLPPGTTLVTATPSSGSCAAATCNLGTIAFPGTATVTYVVDLNSNLADGSLLANTATVTSTTGDPNPGNESTTITTPVTTSADLRLAKTASPTSPVAGETVTWTITVTNDGPSRARGVSVTDTLPVGATLVSATPSAGTCTPAGAAIDCDLGELADGAAATVTVVAQIGAAALGSLTNTAAVSATTPDPAAGNDTASSAATVVGRADLAITKQAVTSPIVPGLPATWTISVTNLGPSDAAGVTVTDPAPAGVTWQSASASAGPCTTGASVTCSVGTLAAGGSAKITVTGSVASTIADGSTLANTASATWTTTDPTPGPTTATSTTPVDAQVTLSVVKTASPDPVLAGQPVTYTLTATNDGPSTATNVTFSDAAPTGVTFAGPTPSAGGSCTATSTLVTCSFASLAPGATATVTIPAAVDPGVVGTAITNVATFDSDQTAPQDATFVNSVGQRADLFVTKAAVTPSVVAGTSAQWRVEFGNNGPSNAQDVTVIDTLPAGMTISAVSGGSCTGIGTSTLTCTVAALAVGATTAVVVTVDVAASTAAGSPANTVSIAAVTPDDPTSSNNSDTATMVVTRSADVGIVKSASGPIVPGDPFSYAIDVTNAGPSTATDVAVTDTLPSGVVFDPATSDNRCSAAGQLVTCTLSSPLAASGAGSSTSIVVGVTTSPALTGSVTNSAAVSSSTPDPDPGDDTASVTVPAAPSADLSVAKTAPVTITAGRSATWTVTITNAGPSDAAGYTITDAAPAGVTWTAIAADVAGATCVLATGACTMPQLAAGASATLTFTGAVAAGATGSIANTASITQAATPDPDPADNSDSMTSPVQVLADLEVAKQPAASPGIAGTQASWTITVTNNGPSAASAVQLTDAVSAGLTLQTLSSSVGSCTIATASCSLGTIPAGATVTINVVTLVGTDQAGVTLTNTAAATSPSDPTPDPPTVASLPVVGEADLSMTKLAGAASVIAGGAVQWTISVVNNGPSAAVGAAVSDTIPAGVSAVSATASVGTCSVTASVDCALGTLAPGQIAFVVVRGTTSAGIGDGSTLANTATVTSATPDPALTDNSATATTPVVARADVRVTKAATTSPFVPGSAVGWTITVVNDGPSDAQAVTVTDVIPTGVSSVSITPAGCTGTTTRSCTLPTLAAGQSFTWTINGTLSASFTGTSLANTATVVAATTDPDSADNSSESTTPVTPAADVAITKSVVGTPTAGGQITWQLRVVDNGPSAASNVVVTDVIPAGVTGVGVTPSAGCTIAATVTCTIASLAVGSPVVLTLSGTLSSATSPTAVVANTANVTTSTPDPNPANNSSTASTSIATSADLSIAKSADGPLAAGEPASWTITVTNAGPSTARSVVVTDTLPADLLGATVTVDGGPACALAGTIATCTLGDIAVGTVLTVNVSGTIDPAHTGSITNLASITGTTPDPSAGNNAATATSAVSVAADLSITKSAAPPTFVAGQPATYRLTVANAGPATATGVAVTDLAPSGVTVESVSTTIGFCDDTVTCAIGDLPPGGSATVTIIVRPSAGFAHATNVVNTATVSSPTADPDTADRTSTTTNQVRRIADIVAAKTAGAVTGPTWDAGENGRYTLSITNLGPSTSGSLTITDVLAADLTFASFVSVDSGLSCSSAALPTITCSAGDVPAGTTLRAVVEVTLAAGATPGSIVNTVDVAQTGADDPNPGDNSASTEIATSAEADLQVTKSTATPIATAGEQVSWTITVTNLGPSNASNVVVSDTLPAALTWAVPVPAGCTIDGGDPATVTCDLATVAPGTPESVTLTADIDPAQAAGQIVNSATVASPTVDPTASNNTTSSAVDIVRDADLTITKLPGAGTAVAGTDVTWTITVTNDGPSAATNVVVTDLLPAELTFVSASDPRCSESSGLVTCTFGTLDPLDSIAVIVTTTVGADVTAASVANTARASTTTPDSVPGNDAATGSITIEQIADLAMSKSASPASLVAGETVTYTLVVTNFGPSTAAAVMVSDPAPAGVTFTTVSSTLGTCDLTLACTIGTMPPGATVTILVTGQVTATAANGASITNSATVTSATPDDPAGAPNTGAVTRGVARIADVGVAKSFTALAPPAWDAGELGRYALTVGNAGPSASGAVTVSDTLPGEVAFVAFVGTPPCTQAAGTVTCTLNDVLPGDSVVIELDVRLDAATAPTDVTNTATVSQVGATDPAAGNNTASITTPTSASADVSVTKVARAASAIAGTSATWDITVANAGPSEAASVVVTDTLPAGLTWSTVPASCSTGPDDTITCALGTLAAGTSIVLTVESAIDPATPAGSVTNVASAASATPDPDPADDSGSGALTITRAADLTITKVAAAPTVVAGTTTSFTIGVANAGPSSAESATVSDVLPAGMTFVAAGSDGRCSAAGQAVTCAGGSIAPANATSFVVVVAVAADADAGSLANTATVASSTADPTLSDNSATASVGVERRAALRLDKAAAGAFTAGGSATWTITVVNDGPSTARDAAVADTYPSGFSGTSATTTVGACTTTATSLSCQLGTLAVGATATISVTGRVDDAATGWLVNTATATSSTPNPNPGAATDTVSTPLTIGADVSITKQGPTQVVAGEAVSWTITVTSAGPAVARTVVVADAAPDGVTLTSTTASVGTCSIAGGVTCQLGDLAPGATVTVTVAGRVDPAAGGPIVNTATASSATADPDTGDNTASVATDVVRTADLSITKSTPSGSIMVGQTIEWTITVRNAGPSSAIDVVVTDSLPASLLAVSVPAECGTGGRTITCRRAVLAAGDAWTIVIATRATATGTSTNTAAVSSSSIDPTVATAAASVQVGTVALPRTGSESRCAVELALAAIVSGVVCLGVATRGRGRRRCAADRRR
jgi:uncharacterized repeat protein (TIGR01451 family)